MSGEQPLGLAATYRACREGAVARHGACEVVRVLGRDALGFLQSQCTQDLDGLGVGESVPSLLLGPQGHVEALVRVARIGEEEALVVVADGFGDAVLGRLGRFKLRVRAELSMTRVPSVEIRGPGALASLEGDDRARAWATLELDWPEAPGVALLGPQAAVPPGVPVGQDGAFEAARIEAGEPAMGSEVAGRLVAQEAGLVGWAVSLTKGCYPGQELVARVDARGANVPRRLRGVVVEGPAHGDAVAAVSPGAALVVGGEHVGSLTSAAWSPGHGATVALGYVRRRAVPPLDAGVVGPAGETLPCRIVEVPFLPG